MALEEKLYRVTSVNDDATNSNVGLVYKATSARNAAKRVLSHIARTMYENQEFECTFCIEDGIKERKFRGLKRKLADEDVLSFGAFKIKYVQTVERI